MDDYAEYLTALGKSVNTIRNYSGMLARARAWAGTAGTDLLRLSAVETAELSQLVPNSNSSRRQLRAALCHYWDMSGVRGHRQAIRVPPRPRPRWRGLDQDAADRLERVARQDWPRGGAVLLGLYLGLRREEIASLRWTDFTTDMDWVRIHGKGDRVRHLPVHEDLAEFLRPQRWPGVWVFPGRTARRAHVSPATISKWVAELGRTAGLGHLHPHQLRHTSGNMVYQATGDITVAQAWLGHAQIETTRIYTRVEDSQKLTALQAFDRWRPPGSEAAA